MGIFVVVLFVLILLLILYCVLKAFASRVKNACTSILTKLKKTLFFDSFIRFFIESNLQMCLDNIFFVALYLSFETEEESSNSYTHLFFVVVIILWQIFAFAFPLCRFNMLQNKDVIAKYGSLFNGIKTHSRFSAVYTGVFCLRRLLIVYTLLYFRDRSTEIKGYEADSMQKTKLIYAFLVIFTLNYVYLVHAQANTENIIN